MNKRVHTLRASRETKIDFDYDRCPLREESDQLLGHADRLAGDQLAGLRADLPRPAADRVLVAEGFLRRAVPGRGRDLHLEVVDLRAVLEPDQVDRARRGAGDLDVDVDLAVGEG